jgi:hypothetical protein
VWALRRRSSTRGSQLGEHEWRIRPGWVLASGVLYLLGLLLAAIYWRRVLLAMDRTPASENPCAPIS